MADWDANSSRLAENLTHVLRGARDHARAHLLPTRELARGWHAGMMAGLDVSPPGNISWIGRFRGERGMEHVVVGIGDTYGVDPSDVEAELRSFEERLQAAVEMLDRKVAEVGPPSGDDLKMILELMSWAHNEWARIHPFANGNGRTARLWANWIAMRYGLAPFVRLRPRPAGMAYAEAAAAGMAGQSDAMVPVFRDMLVDLLGLG